MSVKFETIQPRYFPRNDEVEFSNDVCPNCKHEFFVSTCSDCGGEGGRDGYEEDPLWYDAGDIIPCDMCRGEGFHEWCPRCGWDALLPKKLNTAEHRGMALAALKKEQSTHN